MTTDEKRIQALRRELAGYEARQEPDRVRAVVDELARLGVELPGAGKVETAAKTPTKASKRAGTAKSKTTSSRAGSGKAKS